MTHTLTHEDRKATILGMAHILRMAFDGRDLSELTAELVERINTDSTDAAALLDLSVVLQLNKQNRVAMELQRQSLLQHQHFHLQSNPKHAQLRLLLIMGPGEVMANTPVEFLVENSAIATQLLFLGEGIPAPETIPDHDIAFVAVCESETSQWLLEQLEVVMRQWPRPYINAPSRIARLTRDNVPNLLEHIPACRCSQVTRIERNALNDRFHQLRPNALLIRPIDSHAGHGLAKIDQLSDMENYLEKFSDLEFFVAPFIDYRSEDGWFRKFRVAVIDGQPYPAHMAISRNWMVHYLNADMVGNAHNREQEARFMASFDSQFAVRHAATLQAIDQILELDYYSIDCAETQSGELLVFEIDSGAVVHSMDPVDLFPYKKAPMNRVFSAFQKLLFDRSQQDMSRRAA